MGKITLNEFSNDLKEYLANLGLSEEQVQDIISLYIFNNIGDLSNLKTESKTLVGAINELLISVEQRLHECASISLDQTNITFSTLNSTITLVPTVIPSTCTETIYWHSSDGNIATVENGVVTAKGNGTCTITVTCGDQTATCSVKVATEIIVYKEGVYMSDILGTLSKSPKSSGGSVSISNGMLRMSVPGGGGRYYFSFSEPINFDDFKTLEIRCNISEDYSADGYMSGSISLYSERHSGTKLGDYTPSHGTVTITMDLSAIHGTGYICFDYYNRKSSSDTGYIEYLILR